MNQHPLLFHHSLQYIIQSVSRQSVKSYVFDSDGWKIASYILFGGGYKSCDCPIFVAISSFLEILNVWPEIRQYQFQFSGFAHLLFTFCGVFLLTFFNVFFPFWPNFWKWYDQGNCIIMQLMDHNDSESKEKVCKIWRKKWNWAWLKSVSIETHTVIVL